MEAMLAHQGGWDEVLLVAAPILVFALLLVLANRRATRAAQGREAGPGSTDVTAAPPTPRDPS